MAASFAASDLSGPKKGDVGIDEIIAKLTDGLFGILFVTTKHSDHNLLLHYLEIFIDHMQDLAFPLTFALASWNPSISTFLLRDLYDRSGFEMLELNNCKSQIGVNNIIYYILSSVIGLVIVNALWVGYSFSQNHFRFIWTLKTLRITLGLFATVLFIPVLAFFVLQMAECKNSSGVVESCWQGGNLFKTVVTLIFVVIFIGLALAVKATFFDSDPKKNDITGRSHSRHDIFYTAFRGLLTVLSIMSAGADADNISDSDKEKGTWLMAAACVVSSGLLAFAYVWYIPFYNYRYSVLRAGMMLNFFWASSCLAYTAAQPNSDIGVIYVILCPFAFVAGHFLVGMRRSMIEGMPVGRINDPLVLELKVRFKLLAAGIFYDTAGHGKHHPSSPPGATAGAMGAIRLTVTDEPHKNMDAEQRALLLQEINDIYQQGLRLMPKSCMLHLFSSQFQLLYQGNRSQCLAVTAKAAGMNPHLDEAFMIFKRQRLLNDKFGGGDVIDFIAFEQNLKLAKENERKATVAGVKFWSELMKRNPSFFKLQSHGSEIAAAVSLAQTHFVTLIKLSPNNPTVFRLYGNFLIAVLNDKANGQDLLDHADEIEEDGDRARGGGDKGDGDEDDYNDDSEDYGSGSDAGTCSSLGSGGDDGDDDIDGVRLSRGSAVRISINLFSDSNAVFTISGELANLGQIVGINTKAVQLFGHKRVDYLGKNISMIVPSPFAEAHDGFIRKYLNTGSSKIVDRSRQVLGLHKDGYLLPIILHLKHSVSAAGKQSFVGIVKPDSESPGSGYMIFTGELRLKHATRNLCEIFNLFLSGRHGGDVSLLQWFPAVTMNSVDQMESTGFRTDVLIDEITYAFKIRASRVSVQGETVFVSRVSFRKASKPKADQRTSHVQNFVNSHVLVLAETASKSDSLADNSEGFVSKRFSAIDEPIAEEMCEDPFADTAGSQKLDMPMVFSAHASKTSLAASGGATPMVDDKVQEIAVNFKDAKFAESFQKEDITKGRLSVLKDSAFREEKPADSLEIPVKPKGVILPDATEEKEPRQLRRGSKPRKSVDSQRPDIRSSAASQKKPKSVRKRFQSIEQGSEGSGSKASSSKSVKRILSERSHTSNKHLNHIQTAFIVTLLLMAADAIYETWNFVNTQEEIFNKLANLDTILSAELNIALICDAVRSLDLYRIDAVSMLNISSVDTLEGATNLVLNSTAFIQSILQYLTGDNVLQTSTFRDSTGAPTATYNNFEAISVFLSSAKYVALVDFNDSNIVQNAELVLSNGPTVLMEIFNSSALAYKLVFQQYVETEPQILISSAVIAPCVILAVVVFIIFPIYYHIEKYSNKFLKMFCDIPKEIVKGIHDAHLNRLVAMQDEEDDGSAGGGGLKHQMEIERLMMSSLHGGYDGDTGGMISSRFSDAKPDFTVRMALDRFFKSNHKLGVQALALFLLTAVYFLTSGIQAYNFIFSMHDTAAAMFWTWQRLIYSTLSVFVVREGFFSSMANYIPELTKITASMYTAQGESTGLKYFAHSVQWIGYARNFGSPIMGTTPLALLDSNDPRILIEMSNGCPPSANDPADCSTFLGGILSNGLYSAFGYLKDFVLFVSEIVDGKVTVSIDFGQADATIAQLRDLNTNYLRPNVDTSADMLWMSLQSYAAGFSLIQIVCACGYIALLALMYAFVLRVTIRSMGEELQRTSALVQMLPSEILRTVPSFRDWAQEMGLRRARHPSVNAEQIPPDHGKEPFQINDMSAKIEAAARLDAKDDKIPARPVLKSFEALA
ncbi:hypothetical protein HDU84_005771 [Entophlyctis sp. JEL0112]|nr:hypothetical protein HDU84_005771 [Entophlyctis sp. JEL0112]